MKPSKTAGIILAAGASQRFGSPKQLARFRGKPLLAWAIEAAVQSELDRIVIVLGHAHDQIVDKLRKCFTNQQICTLINHSYRLGQSSSLRLGLSMVRYDYQAVMFLPCDQPLTESKLINQMIAAFRQSPKSICIPVSNGRPGNPTIFGSKHFDALMKIEGDRGGRDLIRSYVKDVLEVRIDNPQVLADIDTSEDLAKLNLLKY